jgi:hypothetical protein
MRRIGYTGRRATISNAHDNAECTWHGDEDKDDTDDNNDEAMSNA